MEVAVEVDVGSSICIYGTFHLLPQCSMETSMEVSLVLCVEPYLVWELVRSRKVALESPGALVLCHGHHGRRSRQSFFPRI